MFCTWKKKNFNIALSTVHVSRLLGKKNMGYIINIYPLFGWNNLIGEFIFSRNLKWFMIKIACLDRIFERRFNFWYFYESFWLTKIVRFQILSKNIEFEILFTDILTLTHVLDRDSFSLNTHNYGWPRFLWPIST